jgi:hypothetical protein
VFRVVYSSRLDPAIGVAEIAAIVDKAQRKNRRHNISGVWLMRDRDCLSALEGPPQAVRAVVERIWDDKRHFDFQLLQMDTPDHREFEGWDLEYFQINEGACETLSSHAGLKWLCEFAGGASAFAKRGLSASAGDDS